MKENEELQTKLEAVMSKKKQKKDRLKEQKEELQHKDGQIQKLTT